MLWKKPQDFKPGDLRVQSDRNQVILVVVRSLEWLGDQEAIAKGQAVSLNSRLPGLSGHTSPPVRGIVAP